MVGQIRGVGPHCADHGVHGPSLEHVHRRGPGPVDMAKLRVAALEIEHASVLKPEAHHGAAHIGHLRSLIVDEPEAGVDARPPDTVARSELHRLGHVHLDPARSRSQPSRFPGDRFSMPAREVHHARPAIDGRDPQLVALLDKPHNWSTIQHWTSWILRKQPRIDRCSELHTSPVGGRSAEKD